MTSARQLRKTGTDLERMLLSAGAAERPDTGSVRRAAKVLGVVPRAALIAATLGIALRATRWSAVAAWSSVPLVGVVGVALIAQHTEAPSAPAATPAVAAVQAATGTPPPRVPEIKATPAGLPASVEPAAVRDAPEPAALSPRVATRKSAPIAVAAGDRLRDQASALDGVRELLALGEPSSALAHLDVYDHRFASGPLHEESQLLRIEALARQGDRAAATSLARRFLKAYPASVHVDRVAAIVQSMTP